MSEKAFLASENAEKMLSKSELKAQRRKVQEEQRAKKAAAAAEKTTGPKSTKPVKGTAKEAKDNAILELVKNDHHLKTFEDKSRKLPFFAHLSLASCDCIAGSNENLHPVVIKLGHDYLTREITGDNERCESMLNAMKALINSYVVPENKELVRELEGEVNSAITYLDKCRSFSTSMENAVRFLKNAIRSLSLSHSDQENRTSLCSEIDDFVRENIFLAGKQISKELGSRISAADTVLVSGYCRLLCDALLEAHAAAPPSGFSVIVVGSRQDNDDGRRTLALLTGAGIACTYVLMSALSFALDAATKVLLGADALLANGNVMGAIGNAQIALMAHRRNIPVLVCSETYKFTESVQTDSLVSNELADPSRLVGADSSLNDVHRPNLQVLAINYDVTPAELIDMVVTEIGSIPCSSVPVVVRMKHSWTN